MVGGGIVITFHIDGLCQPKNPGGYGCWSYVATDENGREVGRNWGCLGNGPDMTNNRAEYQGLIEALKRAEQEGWYGCTIKSDSQLVVNQVNLEWACNSATLRPLCAEARKLFERVDARLTWIPREQNERADHLTNVAYRKAILS
jgi:ribonuclease HI